MTLYSSNMQQEQQNIANNIADAVPVPRPDYVRARRQAKRRARSLLLSLLDPEQRRELDNEGWFVVRGRLAAYRITYGRIANIEVLQPDLFGERVVHRLCVHPRDLAIPIEDVMAAQLLHLRNDEAGLVAIANRHAAGDPSIRAINRDVERLRQSGHRHRTLLALGGC